MLKKFSVFLGAAILGVALGMMLGYLYVGVSVADNPPPEWMNAWADFCLERLTVENETEPIQDETSINCLVGAYSHYEEALESGRSREDAAAMALLWVRSFGDQ